MPVVMSQAYLLLTAPLILGKPSVPPVSPSVKWERPHTYFLVGLLEGIKKIKAKLPLAHNRCSIAGC